MPLDSSIILGVQRPKLTSPQDLYQAKAQIDQNELANRMGNLKMQEFEQGQADNALMRNTYSQFGKDSEANTAALYKAGLGKQAGEYAKSQVDLAKEKALAGKTDLETAVTRMKTVGQHLGFLKDNPTMQNAQATIQSLVDSGIMPPEVGQQKIAEFQKDPSPQGIQRLATMGYQGAIDAEKQMTDATSRRNNDQTNATSRANNAATNATVMRGQDKVDARARETLQQGKVPPGYRAMPDGSLQAISGGPADLKNSKEGNAKINDAKDVLGLLDEVDVLLPKSTGSYAGMAADAAMGAFGKSTEGAKTVAQLKALQGALVSKMPKMSGPQSDKDVLLYREMAGQVGDPSIPVVQRQAASGIIRKLNEKYAGMAPGSSLRNGSTGEWGAPVGGVVDFGSLK